MTQVLPIAYLSFKCPKAFERDGVPPFILTEKVNTSGFPEAFRENTDPGPDACVP